MILKATSHRILAVFVTFTALLLPISASAFVLDLREFVGKCTANCDAIALSTNSSVSLSLVLAVTDIRDPIYDLASLASPGQEQEGGILDFVFDLGNVTVERADLYDQSISTERVTFNTFSSGIVNFSSIALLDFRIPNSEEWDTFITDDADWALTLPDAVEVHGTWTGFAPSTDIPEPSVLSLLVCGLVGLGVARRKKA